MKREEEEELLRSVALQNARSIMLARQRAEEELVQAKEELQKQSEWLRVTLASIGDGVITTDNEARVTSLNAVAASLTGWPQDEAKGQPLNDVFRIINEQSRQPVENPVTLVLKEGRIVGLANHTVLISRDGREQPIDDSAAPIRGANGETIGVVLIFRDVTEQRHAEREMRQSEARKSAILETALDCIISCNEHGHVVEFNPAAERTFGYARADVIGRELAELIIPSRMRERHRKGMTHYMATGEGPVLNRRIEMPACRADGAEFPVELSITQTRTDGPPEFTAYLRDISERKSLERRRLTRLAVAQILTESATTEEAVPRVLRTVCDSLGWDVGALWTVDAETNALRCLDVAHSTSAHAPNLVAACRQATFAAGVGLPGQVWSSGRSVWVPDVASNGAFPRAPIARQDGLHAAFGTPVLLGTQVLGVIEFFSHDIREPDADLLEMMATIGGQIGHFIERRRSQEAMRQSEATTRFLADASAALAELTDYESTLQKVAGLAVPFFADWCAVDMLHADGSIRRLAVTHVDPAKVELAHELARRYPPRTDGQQGVSKVLRTGEPEWVATIPDDLLVASVKDAQLLKIIRDLGLKSYICVPLRTRDRTLGAVTFVTSESGRTYSADALRAAEDLAHRAVIAIENASLVAALKESDRRKDEFLAMLAHELRNPLAPVRSALDLMRAHGPPTPELQWARDVIGRQMEQMTRLVDDLLDVSRITRGTIELRRQRVLLTAVVASAVESSRPLVDERGHQLSVTLPTEPIYLDADATRMAQVLLNLLNNAAKYMDPGGSIWLTAERIGAHVLIRVKDAGVGISAKMLPHIFEMFTQADSSRDRSQGGLGIGLTLVQRLVEMHGGTVEALSAGFGKGSEFVVRLPIAGDNAMTASTGSVAGSDQAAPARKLRILVVDDNKDAADGLGKLLHILGHEVHASYDGLAAVRDAAELQPDVAILDIGLPKLNGYEVARRIREGRSGGIVLIALTGWGQDRDRQRSRDAGFDHHMTKPIEFAALQKLLDSLKLSKRPGESP